jgi:hypothetical protein
MITARQAVLTQVDEFLKRGELSERQLAVAATGDNKAILKLRRGWPTTLRLVEKLEAYIQAFDGGPAGQQTAEQISSTPLEAWLAECAR